VRLRPAAAALLCALVCVSAAGAHLAVPSTAETEPLRMGRPVPGALQSPFGYRWGRLHSGVDLDGNTGDPVRAALPGVVSAVGYLRNYSGYGLSVRIRYDRRLQTLYAHLSSENVRIGESVEGGQVIGRVGCTGSCTGSHLHFEVRVRGNPVDPLEYMGRNLR
jgi:murein DD-endopeptidase MepM/ murein hydrolase activator NlpD